MRESIELLEGILAKTGAEKNAKKIERMRGFRKGERKKQRRDVRGGSAYKHPTPEQKKKKLRPTPKNEEWDVDLCMYLVAKLVEHYGEGVFEGKILTYSSAKEQGLQVGMFFVPPKTIRNIGKEEFPDSVDLWWEAVSEMLKKGGAYDLSDPNKLKPLYGKVMSAWKNKVEAKYGYRPSRSKERSLQQDIDKSIRAAAGTMRAARSKEGVSKEALSRAARAMRARRSAA